MSKAWHAVSLKLYEKLYIVRENILERRNKTKVDLLTMKRNPLIRADDIVALDELIDDDSDVEEDPDAVPLPPHSCVVHSDEFMLHFQHVRAVSIAVTAASVERFTMRALARFTNLTDLDAYNHSSLTDECIGSLVNLRTLNLSYCTVRSRYYAPAPPSSSSCSSFFLPLLDLTVRN